MDAKIVFFDQKYVLYVILRPLELIWGPRELKNPKNTKKPFPMTKTAKTTKSAFKPIFEFKYLDNG